MNKPTTMQRPAVRLQFAGPADAESWDRVARSSDHATFFHTRAWNSISASAPNLALRGRTGRAAAWHIRTTDGVEAVLPAIVYRWTRGTSTFAQSSGGGAYGGWIGCNGFTADHEALAWRTVRWKSLEVRQNPFASHVTTRQPREVYSESSAVIDLSCGYDRIRDGWKQRGAPIHRNARRALRDGVTISAAADEQAWRNFHGIYCANASRWAAPCLHPLETIIALRRTAPEATRLFIAFFGGVVLGGLLLLVHRKHGAGLIKAATPEGYERNALSALDDHTVRHCCEQGLRWYDMDTSGFSENVRIQKLRMGASETPADIMLYHAPVQWALRRVWRQVKRVAHRPVDRARESNAA